MATMTGQPINRIDGPLKVSGKATYAYEHWDAGEPLYGFIVGATIGKGRIVQIDTAGAERSPGVRMVMTYRNAPAQGTRDASIPSQYSRAYPMLSGPDIHHYGEPVALVVATTYEQARAAASLVEVEYGVLPGHFDFAKRLDKAYAPKAVNAGLATDSAVGNFDTAFKSADVKIDQVYTTPYQLSQPMEPHCCLAVPNGDDLTVFVSAQILAEARTAIASTLKIDPLALCRRRLRLQARDPRRDDPGGACRARVEGTRQDRDDPAADLSPCQRASGNEPAGAAGRRAGRPAGRSRP